ncbi:MAG: AAA family ATPase [Lachnospiraceae bacterium]|nr:AAA family ATPase [Lachnospiraceae bacterium]
MKIKNNKVYSTAIQFCKNFPENCPEATILGYAKLISMDEKQVRNLISEDAIEDFETAQKWFSDNKLDIAMIKSGLSLLIANIRKEDGQEDDSAFFGEFLENDTEKSDSYTILTEALKYCEIPIMDLFSEGKSMDDVFAYNNSLKEKAAAIQKAKEEKEAAETEKKAEEEKSSDRSEENESAKSPSSQKEEKVLKKDESRENKGFEDKKAEKLNETAESSKDIIQVRDFFSLSETYRNMYTSLVDVVKGQDQAIIKFIKGYNQGELLKQTEKGNHPKTFYFFFGPPGVGKTLLAENAADAIGLPHKLFNMSEYSHPGLLEDFTRHVSTYIKKNPECLLIFDEIEKAGDLIIKQFLQILGSGRMSYQNVDFDFSKATIIFTSNAGKALYNDKTINLNALSEKVYLDAVMKEENEYRRPMFPPELCSRIASGNTILFNHLSVRHLVSLVKYSFDTFVTHMGQEYGVSVSYPKELPLLFLYNRSSDIDARVATEQSGKFLKDEMYELINQAANNEDNDKKLKNIQIEIDLDDIEPELKQLFKNEESAEVLIFSDDAKSFERPADTQYKISVTSDLDEAYKILEGNISAVFIDPFFGKAETDDKTLSVSDYNTNGVRLFQNLTETQPDMPIFMMEKDREFSEVDRMTFLQQGAAGDVEVDTKHISSFNRQFEQIMEELYMEKKNREFSQRGLIVAYYTKQELNDTNKTAKVIFYGLRKRKAIDSDSMGSILGDAEKPNVRFSDIIGAKDAKEELKYFVNYLKNPRKYVSNGAKAPNGILLYGPPGTGKTMLAKAMAGECDVTFLPTTAASFFNKWFGESEEIVRNLFAKAKRYAPSIIFIDEIDAIGKKRTGSESTHHTESILNTLLTEMQGFETGDITKPVFVLAATNFGTNQNSSVNADLDEALLRRFDNRIYVGLPNESEREEYLNFILKKKGITSISSGAIHSIAERTTGKSLAILQNVLELAIRNARKAEKTVEDNDLLTAIEEYMYGQKKEHTKEYYESVAIHEVGHAYMSYIGGDKPSYITIESRGNFGGYMQFSNQEEVTDYSKADLINRIRSALAGRAAEEVFFGKDKSLNTGASSDLDHATQYAWQIICSYGMDEEQLIVLNKNDILRSSVAAEYIAKVNNLLSNEMKNTLNILSEAKDKIKAIADELVKENKLTGEQFEELMNKQ